ncbi:unnamed protein product [Amoebophrya sp. A25]|nr:unnamed protein product [Amoebophrya sp. A25]|eukprot:GSA25T00025390001.1
MSSQACGSSEGGRGQRCVSDLFCGDFSLFGDDGDAEEQTPLSIFSCPDELFNGVTDEGSVPDAAALSVGVRGGRGARRERQRQAKREWREKNGLPPYPGVHRARKGSNAGSSAGVNAGVSFAQSSSGGADAGGNPNTITAVIGGKASTTAGANNIAENSSSTSGAGASSVASSSSAGTSQVVDAVPAPTTSYPQRLSYKEYRTQERMRMKREYREAKKLGVSPADVHHNRMRRDDFCQLFAQQVYDTIRTTSSGGRARQEPAGSSLVIGEEDLQENVNHENLLPEEQDGCTRRIAVEQQGQGHHQQGTTQGTTVTQKTVSGGKPLAGNALVRSAESATSFTTSRKTRAEVDFGPEREDGNVEYKRMLCTCAPQRLQQLTTQMQYRLREGVGTCVYRIGVDDDGYPRGLTERELEESLRNLYTCACTIDPHIGIATEKIQLEGSALVIGQVTLQLAPKLVGTAGVNMASYGGGSVAGVGGGLMSGGLLHGHLERIKSRVVLCGAPSGGKSSLVGCLVKNLKNDNGSGLARSLVLQFPHEILSGGITSSITKHVYRSDLEIVDVPGDPRYVKTTLRGILGCNNFTPLLLVHDAREPLGPEFRLFVDLAKALNRRLMVLLTKCDQLQELEDVDTVENEQLAAHDSPITTSRPTERVASTLGGVDATSTVLPIGSSTTSSSSRGPRLNSTGEVENPKGHEMNSEVENPHGPGLPAKTSSVSLTGNDPGTAVPQYLGSTTARQLNRRQHRRTCSADTTTSGVSVTDDFKCGRYQDPQVSSPSICGAQHSGPFVPTARGVSMPTRLDDSMCSSGKWAADQDGGFQLTTPDGFFDDCDLGSLFGGQHGEHDAVQLTAGEQPFHLDSCAKLGNADPLAGIAIGNGTQISAYHDLFGSSCSQVGEDLHPAGSPANAVTRYPNPTVMTDASTLLATMSASRVPPGSSASPDNVKNGLVPQSSGTFHSDQNALFISTPGLYAEPPADMTVIERKRRKREQMRDLQVSKAEENRRLLEHLAETGADCVDEETFKSLSRRGRKRVRRERLEQLAKMNGKKVAEFFSPGGGSAEKDDEEDGEAGESPRTAAGSPDCKDGEAPDEENQSNRNNDQQCSSGKEEQGSLTLNLHQKTPGPGDATAACMTPFPKNKEKNKEATNSACAAASKCPSWRSAVLHRSGSKTAGTSAPAHLQLVPAGGELPESPMVGSNTPPQWRGEPLLHDEEDDGEMDESDFDEDQDGGIGSSGDRSPSASTQGEQQRKRREGEPTTSSSKMNARPSKPRQRSRHAKALTFASSVTPLSSSTTAAQNSQEVAHFSNDGVGSAPAAFLHSTSQDATSKAAVKTHTGPCAQPAAEDDFRIRTISDSLPLPLVPNTTAASVKTRTLNTTEDQEQGSSTPANTKIVLNSTTAAAAPDSPSCLLTPASSDCLAACWATQYGDVELGALVPDSRHSWLESKRARRELWTRKTSGGYGKSRGSSADLAIGEKQEEGTSSTPGASSSAAFAPPARTQTSLEIQKSASEVVRKAPSGVELLGAAHQHHVMTTSSSSPPMSPTGEGNSKRLSSIRSNRLVENSRVFRRNFADTDYFKQNFSIVQKEKDVNLFLRKKERKIPVLAVSCVTRYNFPLLEYLLTHSNFFPIQSSFLSFHGVRFVVDYVCKSGTSRGTTSIMAAPPQPPLGSSGSAALGGVSSTAGGAQAAASSASPAGTSVGPTNFSRAVDHSSQFLVVGGNTVTTLRIGDEFYLGPVAGIEEQLRVKVCSIHVRRQPVSELAGGQSCTVQLKLVPYHSTIPSKEVMKMSEVVKEKRTKSVDEGGGNQEQGQLVSSTTLSSSISELHVAENNKQSHSQLPLCQTAAKSSPTPSSVASRGLVTPAGKLGRAGGSMSQMSTTAGETSDDTILVKRLRAYAGSRFASDSDQHNSARILRRQGSSFKHYQRQIRSGMWLYDVSSSVDTYFRRYCLVRLRCLTGCSSIFKDEHLLLYLHSSRQIVRVAWATPVVTANAEHLGDQNTSAAKQNHVGEYCCGLVLLRRKDVCLPGLQVVAVRDGTKIIAGGEIISRRTMRSLTRKSGDHAKRE